MEIIQPQLMMVRATLTKLPVLSLPEGFFIRTFQEGDETAWEAIIQDAFAMKASFHEYMSSKEQFEPKRVLFVCSEDQAVSTASAWHMAEWGEESGYLHMVGTATAYMGKGLGFQISL